MTFSPYRDRESSVYRSRSSSISTPTTTSFLYEEVLAVGENALIRSYSCGHVFGKAKNGKTFQSTQVQISNFMSPVKNLSKFKEIDDRKAWSLPKRQAIEYHRERKPVKARLALTFPDAVGENKCTPNSSKPRSKIITHLIWNALKKSVYLNIIILTVLSASYMLKYKYCSQHWDTAKIATKLEQSVFGQDAAVHKIEALLEKFSDSERSLVLAFTGGTGVGKTFVSSIIYDDFPWVSNKNIYFLDSNADESLITQSFSSCGANLIIIDGLNVLNAQTTLKLMHNMISSLANNEKLLVILIFQVYNEEEKGFVVKSIRNSSIECHHVPFINLRNEDVRQCFYVEIKRQRKFVSEENVNDLLMENMKFCNASRGCPGCKNVVDKVSSLPSST